jgi:hypothetical protein
MSSLGDSSNIRQNLIIYVPARFMLVPQNKSSVTPTVNSVKVDAIDTDTQKTIQGITLNKIILNWLSFEY